MIFQQWLYYLTKSFIQLRMGVSVAGSPAVNSGTGVRTPASSGTYFYKLTAISTNGTTSAVIASAKDINGVAVSGLAGITLRDSITLAFPLTEYTLTSGTVVEYQGPKSFNDETR